MITSTVEDAEVEGGKVEFQEGSCASYPGDSGYISGILAEK